MSAPDWATLAHVVGCAKRPDCLVIIPPGEKGPREVGWPDNPKNLATIQARFKNNPDLNVGILLGPDTGIIDIEVDGPEGQESIKRLLGDVLPTFNSRKGGHWLAFYDSAFDHLPAKVTHPDYPGLEFRIGTKAAQTALPPSTSNGYTRTWASGNIIQLPPDVVKRIADLRAPRVEIGGVGWEVLEQVENGLRDKTLATVLDWIPMSHGEPELVGSSHRIRLDRCPHRPDQDDGAPAIFVNPLGRVVYQCKHSKCAHRTVNDLVQLWGPIKHAATVEPRPSRFTILSSAALAAMAIEIVWLIRGILVAGQHAILGGNQKTLKTTQAAALAVSLASGKPFLGKYTVEKSARVLMMSGESGLAVLKETAERICKANGLKLADLGDTLLWCESLPKFYSDQDVAELRTILEERKVEVLIVDPAYLCMNGDGAENLIKQGDQLSRIGDVCRELGVTFILLHHNKKARSKTFDPPTMEDLAWAGFSEFARQWWLLGRREPFIPGSGEHKLHFVVGGSAGHSGHYHLDIDEGSIHDPDGRRWDVSVRNASDVAGDERQKSRGEYKAAILARLVDNPEGLAKTKLFAGMKTRPDRDSILKDMIEAKVITVRQQWNERANRAVTIYQRAA